MGNAALIVPGAVSSRIIWLKRRPGLSAWLLMAVALTASYWAIFTANGREPGSNIRDTASNVLPVLFMAPVVYSLVLRWAVDQGFVRQLIFHILAATMFAALWFAATLFMQGAWNGNGLGEFRVRTWYPPVIVWQFYQGIAFYIAISGFSYAIDARAALARMQTERANDRARSTTNRLLLRRGDEIHSVDVETIVRIQGNDDYSDVVTDAGSRLARRTLTEFEAELDDARFVRVHRSHLVNLDALVRAEPAGNGRITLHMRNGDSVTASRAGARLVRERSR